MWTNLLSGTVGSVIGVVGAVVVAYATIVKRRRDQVVLAEHSRALDASRDLAVCLVALYDEVKALDRRGVEPSTDDLAQLVALADRFRTAVVVDGPSLPQDVLEPMKDARKQIAVFLTARASVITHGEIARILPVGKEAGDHLQRLKAPIRFRKTLSR